MSKARRRRELDVDLDQVSFAARCGDLFASLRPWGNVVGMDDPIPHSNDSATIRMRKMGRFDSSSSSICHSEFCLSLREMPAAMSAQVLVNAFQAAL